jgi:hypothetical protein
MLERVSRIHLFCTVQHTKPCTQSRMPRTTTHKRILQVFAEMLWRAVPRRWQQRLVRCLTFRNTCDLERSNEVCWCAAFLTSSSWLTESPSNHMMKQWHTAWEGSTLCRTLSDSPVEQCGDGHSRHEEGRKLDLSSMARLPVWTS